MSSLLKITSVESLQESINKTVSSFSGTPGVYVSLNKTRRGVEEIFVESKVDMRKLFFIDCVSVENGNDDTLNIPPSNLESLRQAIVDFTKEIPGNKFLVIDALSTLLIYNSENKVAAFVKEVTQIASSENVEIVALSPLTKGEELLNKIFNFFDKVEKDGGGYVGDKNDGDGELIY